MDDDTDARGLETGRLGRLPKSLLLGGFLLSLAAGSELFLQVYYRVQNGAYLFERTARPIFVADPRRGWSVKPNLDYRHTTNEFSVHVRTNGQGFRVAEGAGDFPLEKDDGTYRILLLGPSFAFGWAASHEDSFAGQLEARLAGAGFADEAKIEIVNAGVPSLPPANNLAWYREVGHRFEPDLILQLIHGSMAVPRDVSTAFRANNAGYLVPARASTGHRVRQAVKKSGLVFYSWSAYAQLRGRLAEVPLPAGEKELGSGSIQGRVIDDRFDPDEPWIAQAIGFYQDLEDAANANDTPAVTVFFPPAYNVHREDSGRWAHDGVWDVDEQLAFNRAFCRYLDEHGLRAVNIDQALIDASRGGERLYYWLDTHWTPLGNRVAATAAVEYLIAHESELTGPES